MDWPSDIEAVLSHQAAVEAMTPDEALELPRRLSRLAFNMTVAGQQGRVAKSAAAAWLFHLCTRNLSHLPQARQEEQERAGRWWGLGEAAGFLAQTEDAVAFVERMWQVAFCVAFCRSRPFDALLLRLAARESCREVWQHWAGQDQHLVERLADMLLRARPARVRCWAARTLGYVADPRALGPLCAALSDASAGGVRVTAAQALGAIKDPRAIEPLIEMLKRDNASVCSEVADALGRFGEPVVLPLIALLKYPVQGVAHAAVKALKEAGDKRAIGPLINLYHYQGYGFVNRDWGLAILAEQAVVAINRRCDEKHRSAGPA